MNTDYCEDCGAAFGDGDYGCGCNPSSVASAPITVSEMKDMTIENKAASPAPSASRCYSAEHVLLMFAEAMRRPKPDNYGRRGPIGHCGPVGPNGGEDTGVSDYCDGSCLLFVAMQPDYETAVVFSCETIKRFKAIYDPA